MSNSQFTQDHEDAIKGRTQGHRETKSFYTENKEHGGSLGTWGTVFAIMSTIVGGGLVSIPWAFLQAGFIQGCIFLAFACIQVLASSNLYLKAREMIPEQPQSMYEQGFCLIGRSSIFLISILTFIQSFGLIVIFFEVFGETMAQFMTNLFWPDVAKEDANFWMGKTCWIVLLAALLMPFILMKELAELKAVSVTLFSSAIIFVIMNIVQIISRGNGATNTDTDYSVYWQATYGDNYIAAFVIVLTACNFQTNLFPIHSHQIDKSVGGSLRSIGLAMFLVASLYVGLSFQGIYMYGSTLEQSILANIGMTYDGQVYKEAYVMQAFFLVILACHIPYCFFAGKESMLIIIDEFMRKSLSYTLSKKLLAGVHNSHPAMDENPIEAARESLTIPHHKRDTRVSNYKPDAEDVMRGSIKKQQDGVSRKTMENIDKSLGTQEISRMTMADMTQLAYKSMNPFIYYSVNVLIYVLQVILGIVLNDIGLVFGFIGTFAGTGLCFFIPSWLFINGYKNFANKEYKEANTISLYLAYINFVLGIFAFGLFLFNNILALQAQ